MNDNSTYPTEMRHPGGVLGRSGKASPRQPHPWSWLLNHLQTRRCVSEPRVSEPRTLESGWPGCFVTASSREAPPWPWSGSASGAALARAEQQEDDATSYNGHHAAV
jgi:hypothetical protein